MTLLQTGIHRRLDDLPFFGLVVALGCGLVFPAWFAPYSGLTGVLLQLIFFTSGLRIDFRAILTELRDVRLFAAVTIFRLVVFPFLVYLIAGFFFPSLVVPLVLLAAMPAGMTSPLFVDMVRGNVPLALLLTAGTSLLSVITLPIILGLLGGVSTAFDPGTMFRTLVFIMVVPLAIAQVVRFFLFGRTLIARGQSFTRVGSILALWLLIATIVSKNSQAIQYGFGGGEALRAFLIMSGLLICFHLACYAIGYWRSRRDRITVTLALSYMNFTLAIFLAETLFRDPAAILVVILSMLPWNIGLIIFQWLVRRNGWTLQADAASKEKPAFAG
ncbi:MAG: bile acid:sodium symporter [Candidatus Moraniibacteriota bacterium]